MALPRIPIPQDRHFRPKLVGYRAVRRNRLAEAAGYGLLFAAFIAVIVFLFATLPWLLRLPGSPLAAGGVFTTAGLVVYGVLAAVMSFLVVAIAALILILALRKYLARVQNREGPLHNGPGGAFQTVADAVKLVAKEDFVPGQADHLVFTLAPAMVFVSAFLLMAVIPFAPTWVLANLSVGLLFIVAAGTIGAYGVLAAGWSLSNKYGLLGGLRAAAQLISYEVPLALSLLSVAVWVGSLNLLVIVESQRFVWTVFPLFIPAAVYLVSSLAEIKMTPFDLPEAESELVAGFNTEYSGMRFGFFFVAEFAELFLLPAIAVVLFFGGYHQPFAGLFDLAVVLANLGEPGTVLRDFGGFLSNFYGMMWFLLKTAVLSWLIMWIRATLPRFRDDQLMELCWKGLIPLSFVGLLVAVAMRLVFRGFGG
ncbi:NADH-quinone oxidoreductase subunit NuoH [soil metagenome]|nr:NADH-quinone oxidoreductase subunit NuoH [Deinococcota bacterium]